jgi:hypothetical protein
MHFVKLLYDGRSYDYKGGTSIEVQIVGHFFATDVGCSDTSYPTFKDWALNDSLGMGVSGNITALEKEGDYVYLTDSYSMEDVPTEVKMTRQQFVQLFDEWQQKVCKNKPREVIIKHVNDQFIIETKT